MDESKLGGWASQGMLIPGRMFSLAAIGNVMTSIREVQALMSLRSVSKPLQELILRGGIDLITNDSPPSNQQQPGNTHSSNASSSSICHCPDSLPTDLWRAFEASYNPQQLRAIASVCDTTPYTYATRPRTDSSAGVSGGSNSSSSSSSGGGAGSSAGEQANSLLDPPKITLLQGPPGNIAPRIPFQHIPRSHTHSHLLCTSPIYPGLGTGKTRTILAVVGALLAGGGTVQKRSSKIITGASLQRNNSKVSLLGGGGGCQENMSMQKKKVDGTMAPKKIRVLVCAPSNTAVDELAYRLQTQGVLGRDGRRVVGLNIVRIGAGGRKEKGNSCEDGGFGSFIGGSNGSQDWTEMTRVVERLHLGKLYP